MDPRRFALIAGILLLLIGLAGFVPPLVFAVTDPLRISARVAEPQLLGLLAISPALNILRIGLGAWGLFASRSLRRAILYARLTALIIGLLVLFGMAPLTDTLFGLAPLYGNTLLFHAFLAVVALLVGALHVLPRWKEEPDMADLVDLDDDGEDDGMDDQPVNASAGRR